jgi:hypothetical protein
VWKDVTHVGFGFVLGKCCARYFSLTGNKSDNVPPLVDNWKQLYEADYGVTDRTQVLK